MCRRTHAIQKTIIKTNISAFSGHTWGTEWLGTCGPDPTQTQPKRTKCLPKLPNQTSTQHKYSSTTHATKNCGFETGDHTTSGRCQLISVIL